MDLTEFCGGEEFFNSKEFMNSTNPDFSNCFQKLVFDLVPCAFLWLFAIPYFIATRNSLVSSISPSRLFIVKVVLTVLLWGLAWADFGRSLYELINSINLSYANAVSPMVVGLAMATAGFFLNLDRLRGVRSSGFLTCYWFLFLISWIFVFKSKVELIMNNKNLSTGEIWRCVTFFISFTCILTHVILSLFVDSPPDTPARDEYEEEEEARFEERLSDDVRKKLCPEYSSSFLSRIIFEWFSSMIMLGYKRPLVDNDLWKLNKVDRCGYVSKHFEKKWKEEVERYADVDQSEGEDRNRHGDQDVLIAQPGQEKKKKKPSLLKVMVGTFGPYFLVGSFLKVINDVLTFVSPQLLSGLISFTTNKTAPMWQGYVLAILMFVAAIFQTIVLQQYFHVCFVVGMRVRSAIIATIYKKSLLLSNSARKTSTVGEVVNLMSVDAQRFMDLMSYLNMIWSAPFQLILALYFLWLQLGPSVLAGVAVMVLLIPFNGLIAKKAHGYQVTQMKYKDERIKLMNEILNGIKVLKMYAWEVSFKDKIAEIRNKELQVLRSAAYLNAAASFTWVCSPVMVALSSFAVYVLSDSKNVLDAQTAFVSISLFNILRFPLIMLPVMISSLVQASVSLARVSKFLSNDELDPSNVEKSLGGTGPAISFDNGTFSWDKDETPVLTNINVSIPKGSLVAVVGQVGSGKSSLISAVLGDMEKMDGTVSIQGSVAYVAQQAWIQNLTVRDNILFGKELDVCKYQQTIEACELKEDFEMLPASDETEIGERGINLSGGQKQRVSLARAVYCDADVYLFDDPLSAVDSHVGKNIFENVLGPGGVLNNKTRVLVTHGVSFLPQVDKIVVLVNGKISEVGGYNELLDKNEAFAEFLRNYAQNEEEIFEDEDVEVLQSPVSSIHGEEDVEAIVGSLDNASATSRRTFERQHSRKSISESLSGASSKPRLRRGKSMECKLPEKKKKEEKDNLITTEEAETGNVRMSVFLMYMKSVGFFICLLIFVAYTLQNAAQVYSNIWLSQWTNDPINPDGTQNKTTLRLTVYGLLGLGQAIVVMISGFSLTFGSVIAARLLHEKMLIRVLRAPMAFFDTTPLGRIINRFSKDIYLVDEVIPRSLSGFLRILFSCLSTFFVIIYSTPIFGVVVVPILILYYFVQRFYIRTSRQLKRLESISRSPIYSHFSETMTGVSTIRAYGLDKSFMTASELKVDTNQMAYFPNIVSNRWLALRLEFVGNLVVLFAAIFAVNERNNIDPSIVGLSISYSLQITSMLNWMVRMASELETNIVAVERVDEYSNIEQEAPLETQGLPPSRDWPMVGSIRFEDYSTRYRPELDLVVRGIDVAIQGGEKVGVVGRTGAGKSSLTLSLFRIIEAATGRIRIDGRTIADIGLHDLRSKISIIPQDPVLFSGTLRMNLDPFDAYTDDQLWDALTHSHLKTFVQTLPKKLEHDVAEGGENLSVGQRQLVCLARALLRKSKILVLDEATAAVDLETDDLIQATIRSQFATSTTFTIAHRLNTIMDSSRVIVLDAGKIVEVDTPENLIELKGIFYSMAKDAGLTS